MDELTKVQERLDTATDKVITLDLDYNSLRAEYHELSGLEMQVLTWTDQAAIRRAYDNINAERSRLSSEIQANREQAQVLRREIAELHRVNAGLTRELFASPTWPPEQTQEEEHNV